MMLTPSPFLLLWKLLRFVVFALFAGVTANSLFLSFNSVKLNVTHTYTHTYTHMHAHTYTFSFIRAAQMLPSFGYPVDVETV